MTWPRSWECVEKPYWQSRIASTLPRLASLMISPALCSQQSMSYSSSTNSLRRPLESHRNASSHSMGKKYKGFEALSPENPILQIRNQPAKRVRIPSRLLHPTPKPRAVLFITGYGVALPRKARETDRDSPRNSLSASAFGQA